MPFFRLTIFDRYLLREILQAFIAILLVLMLVVLSNKAARFLKNATSGEWPIDVVIPMLGLTAISSLVMIMSMAIFLAVMLVTGRLYKDSEMAAISSCGVSTYQLYRPLCMLAVIFGIVAGFMSFYGIPVTKQAVQVLEAHAEKISEIIGVVPGRFHESSDRRRVIYIERVNKDSNKAENAFIHSRKNDGFSLITARLAHRHDELSTGDTLIFLQDGYRYQGGQGMAGFRSTQFRLHWIRAEEGRREALGVDHEARPTLKLIGSVNPVERAELHMRVAIAISPILFIFLGLPLGRLKQREGRYGRIMIGVLIYIIYFKLLRVGQAFMEREAFPAWLGLWWVHLGLVLYLFWVLYSESRLKSGSWWPRRYLKRAG